MVWALLTGPVVTIVLRQSGSAWGTMLAYHLGCAVAAGTSRAPLGRRPQWRGLVLLALVLAAASCSGLRLVLPLIQDAMRGSWRLWGLTPPGDLPLLAYYVGVNAGLEEWFWRGAVLEQGACARLGTAACRGLAVLGFLPLHLGILVLGVWRTVRNPASRRSSPGEFGVDRAARAYEVRLVGGCQPLGCGPWHRAGVLDLVACGTGLIRGCSEAP